MRMLRDAAYEASKAYQTHWVRRYISNAHRLISDTKHPTIHRMRVAGLHGDIECIMRDLETYKQA